LNVPGQNEKEDVPSTSEEEEATPRPKRTTPKMQVDDDGISELASTDDPEWEMSVGDSDEDEPELDSTDIGTMEEDETLGANVDDSDPEEGLQLKKSKKSLSKSSKQKNTDKGKGPGKLRAAILQGRQQEQPAVRPTRVDGDGLALTDDIM
jgi:hypothetical protein